MKSGQIIRFKMPNGEDPHSMGQKGELGPFIKTKTRELKDDSNKEITSLEDQALALLVDISALDGPDYPEHPYLVDYLFPKSEVVLLAGHGGVGKSLQTLIWCAHLAVGRNWVGLEFPQARSMIITFEDSGPTVRKRLQYICQVQHIDAAIVKEMVQIVDLTGLATALAGSARAGETDAITLNNLLFEMLQILITPFEPELIVMDNASQAFAGNENIRAEVSAFIATLKAQFSVDGRVLVLCAHVDKVTAKSKGSQGYSGSTAWHNSARSRIVMWREDEDDDVIKFKQEKNQYGPKLPALELLNDKGVLKPLDVETKAQQQATIKSKVRKHADAVLRLFDILWETEEAINANKSGPRMAVHQVMDLAEFAIEFDLPDEKKNKHNFKQGLSHLIITKQVKNQKYTDINSNKRIKIVRAEPT